jgi:uncharacterized lipoprotein YmbA
MATMRAGPILLLALLLGACAGGGEIRYYLLDPAPGPVLREGDAPLAVRVVDLEVPQYLERFQIARRTADNRIAYDLNDQWGEPLRETLIRTLGANLSATLDTVDVSTPLARLASAPDIAVKVHVDRFEPAPDGRVHLDAHWQLVDPASGDALHTEQAALDARVDGAGAAADVRTMQRLFGELSDRVAASVLAALEARG